MSEATEKYTAGNGRYEIEVEFAFPAGQRVRHWDNVDREAHFSEFYLCEHGYEAACMHAGKIGAEVDQEPPQYVYDAAAAEEAEEASRGPGIV